MKGGGEGGFSWEEAKEKWRLADFRFDRSMRLCVEPCSARKRSNFRHFLQSKFTVGSSLVFNELKRSSDEGFIFLFACNVVLP